MSSVVVATSGKDSLTNIKQYNILSSESTRLPGNRFFKVSNSSELISLKNLLTDRGLEKLNKGEQLLLGKYSIMAGGAARPTEVSDFVEGFSAFNVDGKDKNVEDLLSLINNQAITTNKPKFLYIKHNGRNLQIEPDLYFEQNTKEDSNEEKKEYYVGVGATLNANLGQKVLLEKEKITPPAFKKAEVESFTSNGHTVYDADVKVPMVKYEDEEGKTHYVRNAKVKYALNEETGKYDAIITKTKDGKEVASRIKSVASNDVGLSTVIKNVKKHPSSPYLYTVHNPDGTEKFRIEVSEKRIQFHENVGGRWSKFAFRKGGASKWGFPVDDFSVSFEKNELRVNVVIKDLSRAVISNGKIVGLRDDRTERLFKDFPHIKKFNIQTKQQAESKISFYNESNIFKTNSDGKEEVGCDIIQTADIDENGECVVYDYAKREEVFASFEKNIEECKKLANLDSPQIDDIKKLADLQKVIEGQLGTLGDLESAKLIEEKHKKWQEEKAKTGAERDQSAIDLAKKEYDEALKNVGFFKDKKNLANIDDLIKRYQEGEFFPTFFFDENGNKVEINSGDLTEISSCLPYDWSKSKAISSIIGKDKVAFNKNTAKANVEFNPTAKEVAVGSIKVAGALLNASFSMGVVSLLIAPVTLSLACAATAVSAATWTAETIRKNVKQSRINNLTPQKIKDLQNKDLEKTAQKEFEKALEDYNSAIAHAKRTQTSIADLKRKTNCAKDQLRQKRKEIYAQYVLAGTAGINCPFNMKDKKITNQNILGFSELRRRKKEILEGKKIDAATSRLISQSKEKYKQDLKKAEATYALDPKNLKFVKERLAVERDDAENTYFSENGPLKKREDYFKKTLKYYLATDSEKQKMLAEFKEKNDKVLSSLSVENVNLKGAEGEELEAVRKRFLKLAEQNMPKQDYDNDLDFIQSNEKATPIAISANEKGLENHEPDLEAEKMNEVVNEYETVVEEVTAILAEKDVEKQKTQAAEKVAVLANEIEKSKDYIKSVLKDDILADKVIKDEGIWHQGVNPKSRDLEIFADRLKILSSKGKEEVNKFLATRYGETFAQKNNELLADLQDKLKDNDKLKAIVDEKFIDKVVKNKFKLTKPGRYGPVSFKEAKNIFLNDVLNMKDSEKYLEKIDAEIKLDETKLKKKFEQEAKQKEIEKLNKKVLKIRSWLELDEVKAWIGNSKIRKDKFNDVLSILEDPMSDEAELNLAIKYFEKLKDKVEAQQTANA